MAPYGIAVDQRLRTVRATLRGFWDMTIVTTYLADLGTAAAEMKRSNAPSWWLIDLSHSQVQSREVAGLMRDKLPSILPPAMTLAIVVDASLPAVQVKRVASNEHHRHFSTLADAERWLSEQGMPA